MTKHQKDVLNQLSKEQLIYLIEQLVHGQFLISETCVEESKSHIASDEAVNKIREHIYNIPYISSPKELKAYIDMKMDKISVSEYRRIIGLDEWYKTDVKRNIL